ncbi:MAG: DUF3459 domain-containing protein [Chloroflexia bacterium]|nr:DUF3459 domain-containing protein [Chloroflexia bacterium]
MPCSAKHQRARLVAQLTGALLVVAVLGAPAIVAAAPATPIASPTTGGTPVAGGTLPWWRDAVCYEVFVRSFSDSDGDGTGDLPGLIEQLDYLNDGDPSSGNDLGVSCIWLMPIMESTSYHGYDVTDFYAIERDYGTNDDFRHLMDEAHGRGIRVIIDLVLNHTSVEHPWFQQAVSDPASPYRDWYIFEPEDPGYPGPWGAQAWHPAPDGGAFYYGVFWSGMPDLNYRNPAVTTEMEKVTAFWLTEMGVDGFRFDAIKHLIEEGRVQESTPATLAWIADYSAFVRAEKPEAYMVGEVAGAGTDALSLYYPGLLDAYFHFELAQQTVNAANFGIPRQLAGVAKGTEDRIPDQRFATFLTNHDQPRIATQLGGAAADLRLAAMLLLTMPGTPFIYYGEEIGMAGDKPDERIRTPMQWSPGPGGGFTTGRPWESPQDDWQTRTVAAQPTDPASLLAWYRTLIHARAAHPALGHGDFTAVASSDPNVFAFLRTTPAEQVLVLINLGSEPAVGLSLTAPVGAIAAGAYGARDALGGPQAGQIRVDATDTAVFTLPMYFDELPAKSGLVLALTPSTP